MNKDNKVDTDPTYTLELRRQLRIALNRTIALQFTAGLVSFVAVSAWIFLGMIVWTAASNEPTMWKRGWRSSAKSNA